MIDLRSPADGKRVIVTLPAVLGYLAAWAIRQSPYVVPDKLSEAVVAAHAWLLPDFNDGVPDLRMRKTTFQELEALLKFHLMKVDEIVAWNARKNGNKAKLGFVSATFRPEPDDDFIDLDALFQNVARSAVTEDSAR